MKKLILLSLLVLGMSSCFKQRVNYAWTHNPDAHTLNLLDAWYTVKENKGVQTYLQDKHELDSIKQLLKPLL